MAHVGDELREENLVTVSPLNDRSRQLPELNYSGLRSLLPKGSHVH